jgi:hypothetical protein
MHADPTFISRLQNCPANPHNPLGHLYVYQMLDVMQTKNMLLLPEQARYRDQDAREELGRFLMVTIDTLAETLSGIELLLRKSVRRNTTGRWRTLYLYMSEDASNSDKDSSWEIQSEWKSLLGSMTLYCWIR